MYVGNDVGDPIQEHDGSEPENYKGYTTFKDVEDKDLRVRNQSITLWTIYDEHSKDGMTSAKGVSLLSGYLLNVLLPDRPTVMANLHLMVRGGSA